MPESTDPYVSPSNESATSPGAQWGKTVSPSLQQTALGLSLIYYGILIALLSAAIMVIGTIVNRHGSAVFSTRGSLGAFVGQILCMVGAVVCLAAPDESNARRFLIGSVAIRGISLVYSFLYYLIPTLRSNALTTISGILGCVRYLVFMLFLKNLSVYIGRADLARKAKNVLMLGGLILVLFLPVFLGIVKNFGLLGPVILIAAIVTFVIYVNLINELRRCLKGE